MKPNELKKFIGEKIEIIYGGSRYQGILTSVMEKTFSLSIHYISWGTDREEEFFLDGVDQVKLVDP